MFDSIVQELGQRFGLSDQAAPLVQGALAYISKADHGGLAGFVGKFEAAGLGTMAHSWMGGSDGAQNISPAQLETVLGNKGGLISQLVASTGVARQSVTPALGYLLPALIGVLSPTGQLPASLPPEVAAFASGKAGAALGAITGAAPQAAQTLGAGATMLRWVPWLLMVLLALGVLGWCSKAPVSQDAALAGTANDAVAVQAGAAAAASAAAAQLPAATPASAAAAAASSADTAVAVSAAVTDSHASSSVQATAAPLGAGVLAERDGDKPMLKIYFDVSRAQVAPEFAKVAADLLAYLGEHKNAKVSISGFNDPTGNAVQNAKLSKQRAEAVRSALKAQGLALNRMELVKPADAAAAAAAGANNAELRRVEVRVR